MKSPQRGLVMSSPYMAWARVHQKAEYNLAASGIRSLSLADLGADLSGLQITAETGDGYGPLTRAIASRYGVPEGCVVTTLGTSMANHLAMAALVRPGDEVLIEHPTYELLLSTAQYLGASVRRFRRSFSSGFSLDPERIASAVTRRTRLVVLTNLHNPSGALASADEIEMLGRMARSRGARVLVDEVYLEGAFDEAPPTSLLLGDEFLVTSSLTKVFGLSGLRCGWILAEERTARRIWRLKDLFYAASPHPTEWLSALAFSRLEEFTAENRRLVIENRKVLGEFLAEHGELSVIPSSHGTVVFPRLPSAVSVERLVTRLREEHQTAVVPGRFFGLKNHIRIGIGCETATLREGLRRLGLALRGEEKRKAANLSEDGSL